MHTVTCTLGMSLDGYVTGPDGGFDWAAPDDELFLAATDQVRRVSTYLLGRRLYEAMRYWDTAEQDPSLDDARRAFAALWKGLPKVVFSRSLSHVEGARLATGSLAEEVARLRAEPGESEIAVGGATLAAEAAALGLLDEYCVRVYPVLVGGGAPLFPQHEQRTDLELLDSRTFPSRVVQLRYRVVR